MNMINISIDCDCWFNHWTFVTVLGIASAKYFIILLV